MTVDPVDAQAGSLRSEDMDSAFCARLNSPREP